MSMTLEKGAGGAAGWVDDRIGAAAYIKKNLNKVFPDHWSFMLGEIALYSFIVLLLTGTFLTFFFDASTREVIYNGSYMPMKGLPVSAAYSSTLDLSFDVRGGLIMRQMHHWAALLFAASIVVHLMRVFFTGAFRKPRELNWLLGVLLLILAIVEGFAGYSLPDDLLSGTGLRIAYSIALSMPVIGTWAAFLLFGGEFPGDAIIGRLYAVHILLVPLIILGVITVHLMMVWYQKHTQFPGPGRKETNVIGSRVFPAYAAK
ncbi:MAG: ubiquinol-cytochrome c reductase cytochrome b subunit, partial [Frankiales bacterium]|nr:ubiquinol-cytochrome c reductase cytochrome b subunit [Frankiales bacterium]